MSHMMGRGHCGSCKVRHRSIFATLSELQLSQVAVTPDFHPSVVGYADNETIYHQLDAANYVYTIRSGVVKLVKLLPNGRSQIVRLLQEGDLFGIDGFGGETYNQTAVALNQVELCKLPVAGLLSLKRQTPEIEQALMQRWIAYIRDAEDMMVELGAKKAGERLASFLIRWSGGSDEWIELPLTRAEMGELLGLTIETVSRFLSAWKKNQLIDEQQGSIRILDVTALRKQVSATGSC